MSQGRENEVGEDAGNRGRDARDADEREGEREPAKEAACLRIQTTWLNTCVSGAFMR